MTQLTLDELRQTERAETRYCKICDAVLEFQPCGICGGTGIHAGFRYTKFAGEELEGLPCPCEACMGLEGNWLCPTHGPVIVMDPERGEHVIITSEAECISSSPDY
jgi:hypothetical protein